MNPPLASPFVSSWRDVCIALGVSLVLLIGMYWTTAASTVASWSSDPLAHGYLVIPAVLYLAWDRRSDLELLSPRPAFPALLLLGPLALLWLLGSLSNTDLVQQISLVAMMISLVWAVLGTPAARVLLFPLAFLLFALPLGDRLIPALQNLTARFAVNMLDLSGAPVLLQGHVISIPGSSWQVAEACSGINYLMSSLAVGYVYAGTTYRSWTHRVGFVAASVVLPLAANGLRVYATILIASLGGTRIVAGMGHYLFGWFIFAIVMGLLFATCGRWREDLPQPSATRRGAEPARSGARWNAAFVAALGLVIVGIAPASAMFLRVPVGADESTRPTPQVSLPWRVAEADRHVWAPRFVTPGAEFLQSYESGNRQLKLYVAYYGANQPDVKLASAANVLFQPPWQATGTRHITATHQGRSFRVSETRLEAPQSSLVVWHWYWVDGTFTGDDYLAKLLLAKARLFRNPRGSAAIAVATENRPGVQATATLEDFLGHLSLTESSGALSRPVTE